MVIASPGTVMGASCEGLGDLDDVTFIGAVKEAPRPIDLISLPDAPVDHYFATEGFIELLNGTKPPVTGLAVSRELADALDLGVGDTIATSAGSAIVGSIFEYPADGRRTGFGWSVVEVSHDNTFDECWATSWPMQPELRSLLLTAISADGAASVSDPPTVAQLNASKGQSFDVVARWAERPTRLAPLAVAVLLAAFSGAMLWSRRLEMASNLHAGVKKMTMAVIVLLELLPWVAPAALVPILVTFSLCDGMELSDRNSILWIGVQSASAVWMGALVGTSLTLISVRESALFVLYKGRN